MPRGKWVMARFRLNGWQRIGIIISVVWALGSLIYAWPECVTPDGSVRKCPTSTIWDVLTNSRPSDHDAKCHSEQAQSLCEPYLHNVARRRLAQEKLLWGLAPIPLGWLLIYALVAVVRWIKAGFKNA